MNIIKYNIIFLLILVACNKPATKNDSAFLSLLITQTSGTCAMIEKTTSNGSTIYRASIPKLQGFFKEEITNSERKALSETITSELNCVYGNGVSAIGESGVTPAIGICPTTYPLY